MATEVGEAYLTILPSAKGLERRLQREVGGSVDRVGRESGSRFSGGFVGAAAGGMGALKGMAIGGTVALAGLGVAGASAGIKTAASMQQANIAFSTLLGSGEKAQTFLDDLAAFGAKTPFEMPGLINASRQLIGVGASAKSVIPTLTAWGDTAGALGLSQEQFERAMLATTQSMSKGKVQAEELMQITEAGIPIYPLLAKAMNKSVPELQKLASEGKLLAKDVFPALEKQMGKDYGGAMAKQSKTLTGLWSTLMDTLNMGLANAIEPLMPVLGKLVPAATSALGTALSGVGGAISSAMNTVGAVLPRVGNTFKILFETGPDAAQGFAEVLDNVFGNTGRLVPVFRAVGDAVRAVVFGFQGFFSALREGDVTSDGFVGVMERLGVTVRQLLPAVGQIASTLGPALGRALSAVLPLLGKFGDFLTGTVFPALVKISQAFVQHLLPPLLRFGRFLLATVVPAIANLVGWLIDKLAPIFTKIANIVATQVVPILGRIASFVMGTLIPAVVAIVQNIGQKLRPVFEAIVGVVQQHVLPAVSQLLAKFAEWWPTISKVIMVVVKIVGAILGFAAAILGKVLPPVIRFAGFLIGTLFAVIGKVIGIVVKIIGKVIEFGGALWEGIKAIGRFAGAVAEKVGDVQRFFQNLPAKILGYLTDAGKWLWDTGKNLIQGLIDGLMSMGRALVDALIGLLPDALEGVARKALGISSPSKLTYGYGANIAEGLIRGVKANQSKVDSTFERLASGVGAKGFAPLDLRASVGGSAAPAGGAFGPHTEINVRELRAHDYADFRRQIDQRATVASIPGGGTR